MKKKAVPEGKAFTLPELLAVLAVVVLLLGLLFPMFQKARERSMRLQCLSNLRQIGVALFAYASDHDGKLPPVSSPWPPSSSQQQTWGYAIWTYAGYSEDSFSKPANDLRLTAGAQGDNIFRCPSTRIKAVPVPTVNAPNPSAYSYGLNCRPVDGRPGYGDSSADWQSLIPLAKLKKPASTAMVMESSYCLGSMAGFWLWYGLMPHGGGSNILFYDGHAELRLLEDIPREDSGEGRIFWNGN